MTASWTVSLASKKIHIVEQWPVGAPGYVLDIKGAKKKHPVQVIQAVTFLSRSWRMLEVSNNLFKRVTFSLTISKKGHVLTPNCQVSNEKNPGWLGYIGDYTTQLSQLYRDYNKPLYRDYNLFHQGTKSSSPDRPPTFRRCPLSPRWGPRLRTLGPLDRNSSSSSIWLVTPVNTNKVFMPGKSSGFSRRAWKTPHPPAVFGCKATKVFGGFCRWGWDFLKNMYFL